MTKAETFALTCAVIHPVRNEMIKALTSLRRRLWCPAMGSSADLGRRPERPAPMREFAHH